MTKILINCGAGFIGSSVTDRPWAGDQVDVTIIQLAELIIRLTGSKNEIEFQALLKEGDMTRRQPDATKMTNILNRKMIPLEEGIASMLTAEGTFSK